MNSNSAKTLGSALFSLSIAVAAMNTPAAFAQEVENTRYSPQGRLIAREVGNEFGDGLFEVRTYDPEPSVAEFSKATIFYPLTLSFAPSFGAVAFVPGYRGTQEIYNWWGPTLASLGIAVMIIDTNQPEDSLEARKQALVAAIEFLQNENSESDSPIQGKLDTSKFAIMGHSLGGGAALHAAITLGDSIKAVIPLSPYCCELGQSFEADFGSLTVPTLIFVSAEDNIAPPEQHAKVLYDAISDSTRKAYLEFVTGDHMIATNDGPDLESLARYTYAWLKTHFDEDPRYMAPFSGELDDEYAAKFSRFESTQ